MFRATLGIIKLKENFIKWVILKKKYSISSSAIIYIILLKIGKVLAHSINSKRYMFGVSLFL